MQYIVCWSATLSGKMKRNVAHRNIIQALYGVILELRAHMLSKLKHLQNISDLVFCMGSQHIKRPNRESELPRVCQFAYALTKRH